MAVDPNLTQSIKNVEQALSDLGINPGAIDGVADEAFKRAITQGFGQAALLTGKQYTPGDITGQSIDEFKGTVRSFLSGPDYDYLKKIQRGEISDAGLLMLRFIEDPAQRLRMALEIKSVTDPKVKAFLDAAPESVKNNIPKLLATLEKGETLAEDVRKIQQANVFGTAPAPAQTAAAPTPAPAAATPPASPPAQVATAPAAPAVPIPVDTIDDVRAWLAKHGHRRPGESPMVQLFDLGERDNSPANVKDILDLSARVLVTPMNNRDRVAGAPREQAREYSPEFMARARQAVATDPSVKAAIERQLPPGITTAEQLLDKLQAMDDYRNGRVPGSSLAASQPITFSADTAKEVRAWMGGFGVGQIMGREPENSPDMLKHLLDMNTRLIRDRMNRVAPGSENANEYSREFLARARQAVAVNPTLRRDIESKLPAGVRTADELFARIQAIDVHLNGPIVSTPATAQPATTPPASPAQSPAATPPAATTPTTPPATPPASTTPNPATAVGSPSVFVVESVLHMMYDATDDKGDKIIPNMPLPGARGGEFDEQSGYALYHAISMVKADLAMRGVFPLAKDTAPDGTYTPGQTDALILAGIARLSPEDRRKYTEKLGGDAAIRDFLNHVNKLHEEGKLNQAVAATFQVNQQMLMAGKMKESFLKFLPPQFVGMIQQLFSTGIGKMLVTLLGFLGIDVSSFLPAGTPSDPKQRLITGYNEALATVGGDHSKMPLELKSKVDGTVMWIFTNENERNLLKSKIDEAFAHSQTKPEAERAAAFADYMMSQAEAIRNTADADRRQQIDTRNNPPPAAPASAPANSPPSTTTQAPGATTAATTEKPRVEINLMGLWRDAYEQSDGTIESIKPRLNAAFIAEFSRQGVTLTDQQKTAMREIIGTAADTAKAQSGPVFWSRTFSEEVIKGIAAKNIDLGVTLVETSPQSENEREAARSGRLRQNAYGQYVQGDVTVRDGYFQGLEPVPAQLREQARLAADVYMQGIGSGRIRDGERQPLVYDLGNGCAIITRPNARGDLEQKLAYLERPPAAYAGLDGKLNVHPNQLLIARMGANGALRVDNLSQVITQDTMIFAQRGDAATLTGVSEAYNRARADARQGYVDGQGRYVQGQMPRNYSPGSQPYNFAADMARHQQDLSVHEHNKQVMYAAAEFGRHAPQAFGLLGDKWGTLAIHDVKDAFARYGTRVVPPITLPYNTAASGHPNPHFAHNAYDVGGRFYARSPSPGVAGLLLESRMARGAMAEARDQFFNGNGTTDRVGRYMMDTMIFAPGDPIQAAQNEIGKYTGLAGVVWNVLRPGGF